MNPKDRLVRASLALGTVGLVVLATASGCGPAPDTTSVSPDAAVFPDTGAPDASPDADPGDDGSVLMPGACPKGTADCDGDPRNGCEAKLDSDAKNCGACKHDCTGLPHVSGATTCSAGKCVVPASSCAHGFAHCSTNPDDGCEADLSKPATCGACGTSCSGATPICSTGACSNGCSAATPTQCSGSCVDTTTSAANCHGCGNACPAPAHGQATCAASACGFACNTGYHACGGACADDTSPATCGTSCTPCSAPANGYATCSGGACDFACNPGFHRCGSGCASDSDATACGASCTVCTVPSGAGHATCSAGACGIQCDAGDHLCGASTCASNSSVATCGTSCTPCAAPASNGHATCDGTSCGIACDASYHQCGGACASNGSVQSCGASCTPCPTPANAQPTCNGVACGFTCNAGFADCDGNAANGCEVNLASDQNNCNACGHSCLGGACSASACQQVLLATAPGAGGPLMVASNQDLIAFGDGSNATAMHKDGTNIFTKSGGATVRGLTTDGSSLYFTASDPSGQGNIWRQNLATPASSPVSIFSGSNAGPAGLSLAVGDILLWTDVNSRTVGQQQTSGANRFTLYTAPAGSYVSNQIVNDGDYQYVAWIESNGHVMKSTDALVTESVAATLQNPRSLAIDSSYLYVTDATSGIIWRISRATNQAYQLAIQQTGATGIAVDASYVYWTISSASGSVMRAPIGGGNPVALVTGLYYPADVRTDDKAIYWMDGIIPASVKKIAK